MTVFRCATLSFVAVFSVLSLGTAHASNVRGHGAHTHGEAKMNIVVEGQKAKIEFISPSDGVYGFEHEAKTEADIKKRDEAVEKLKASFSSMVVFDPALNCKFTPVKVDPFVAEKEEEGQSHAHKHSHGKKKGTHSEVHAEFDVECAANLSGTKVNFAVTKTFPRIKRVKVQLISGDKQAGADVRRDRGSLDL